MAGNGRIEAVLGPTNTGKTHYAIERMLAHRTGVIGLPLRLLAREVYDRIKALRGPSVVALVTGEERIVPERTQYWVCTVEAMPEEIGADFVAIDEIQLCGDPERGHVFTDRLLRARGLHETLFLGADTMRGAIAAQVPKAGYQQRERLSELTYAGAKKISRMPARSAIVGFSVENVYAIAELLRRQKGGAAVVMGALSPRTRNAQVELYQSGEVDYLVATAAIGMGLNLDIRHVAFSSTMKFDGRRMRPLAPNELAQIAGRAGRHTQNGTFGVTGEAKPLNDDLAEAIVANRFTPVRKLQWRNARLDFASPERLIASLEARTDDEWLTRARDADDVVALKTLAGVPAVRDRVAGGRDVRLLWDVCRIPDFRGISHAEHASLLQAIFEFLHGPGRIPEDWMARQVERIDRTSGDIDALSKRLAYIRTWTYVAQRVGWLADESHWREVTRAVEDRLSDALHARLTQRFVDRRTSVLMRRLKQKEALVAEVSDTGEVTVEGQHIGRLEGFRFLQDKSASPDEARTLRQAGIAALAPHFHLRADRLYNAPDTELDITEQGGLMWGESAVGRLIAGPEPLKPRVRPFVDDEAGAEIADKVERRLQHYVDRRIAALFEPLLAMQSDEAMTGLARGFAYQLLEAHGVLPRDGVAAEVKALDQEARGALRKHGIRFGQFTVFLPALLKPAPTRLRLVLWSLALGLDEFPESPPPGLVTVPVGEGLPEGYHAMAGYRAAGQRAIRIDMLERLADLLRAQDSRAGFEATPEMLSITGMTLEQFADLMRGLGYAAERGERAKQRVPAKPAAKDKADTAPEAAEAQTTEAPDAAAAEGAVAVAEASALADADVGMVAAIEAVVQDSAPSVTADAPTPEEAAGPSGPAEDPPAVDRSDAPEATEADVATPEPSPEAPASDTDASDPAATDPAAPEAPADTVEADADSAADDASGEATTTEVFYTFTWAPRRRPQREGARKPGRRGKAKDGQDRADGAAKANGRPKQTEGRSGKPPRGKGKPKPEAEKSQTRTYSAKPPKREKPIDPDNPFAAALMGLRDKQ